MHFANFPRIWRLPRQLRSRLMLGVTLSLLFHALLLSLQFGIPGLGMPGLELPWSERRAQTPELSVHLMNVQSAPPRSEEVLPESPSPAAAPIAPAETVAAVEPPRAEPPADRPQLKMLAPREPPKPAPPVEKPKPAAVAKKAKRSKPTPPAIPEKAPREPAPPQLIARTEPNQDAFVVPAPSPEEPAAKTPPVLETPNPPTESAERAEPEAAPSTPEEDPAALAKEQALAAKKIADQENAQRAQELQEKKQEEANAKRQMQELEARKQADEQARKSAAVLAAQKLAEEESTRRNQQLEALRLEQIKKQEQAKAERQALELEAKKQEQTRAQQQALELDARKRSEEAARQQAAAEARQKQAEESAAKEKAKQAEELAAREAARQAEELVTKQRAQEAADRQQAAVIAAQQRERDRMAAGNQAAANAGAPSGNKQMEQPSASNNVGAGSLIGKALGQARQLDLPRSETPIRDPLPGTQESPRRRSIFGSLDKDVGLAMYIDAWRLKIERNGRLNYSQSSSEKARGDPVVTVAIRSDGSVEDVIINRSSGRPELDEAVRRIVRINTRYSSFPPALARSYDVIEIRRIWSFDDVLRIVEEVR